MTGGHKIREADSDALIGETESRPGIGFEIRGQLGKRAGVALTGEYIFKAGEGPLREGARAAVEGDLFLLTQGAARVYAGALVGSEYASYAGLAGGQSFEETRFTIGPTVGALLRLGRRARLGLKAEYLFGSSAYKRSYKDEAVGQPPKIATPGTLVFRAQFLLLTR